MKTSYELGMFDVMVEENQRDVKKRMEVGENGRKEEKGMEKRRKKEREKRCMVWLGYVCGSGSECE